MTQPALPVLYTFRRCPYAMRARMALLMCAQNVELREVQLSNKPLQMINASAKATVPVLCLPDGTALEESLDIMQWAIALSNDPENLFNSGEQQTQLDLICYNDTEFKHWLDHYKYHARHPEQPLEFYRNKAEQFLDMLEARLDRTPYLFGIRPQLADIAIVPFIRQFAGVDKHWFDHSHYSAVNTWLADWQNSAVFTNVMVKYPPWHTVHAAILLSAATEPMSQNNASTGP